MSITDELRAGGKHAPVSNTRWLGEEELAAIADLIDAEHKKAVERARMDGMDATFGDGWVELPVDADGVPIHVGDVMEWPDGSTFDVVGISANTLFYVEHDFDDSAQWTAAHNKRHHQPDSWERIIQDAIAEGFERTDVSAPCEVGNDELVERCRRVAGDAE